MSAHGPMPNFSASRAPWSNAAGAATSSSSACSTGRKQPSSRRSAMRPRPLGGGSSAGAIANGRSASPAATIAAAGA